MLLNIIFVITILALIVINFVFYFKYKSKNKLLAYSNKLLEKKEEKITSIENLLIQIEKDNNNIKGKAMYIENINVVYYNFIKSFLFNGITTFGVNKFHNKFEVNNQKYTTREASGGKETKAILIPLITNVHNYNEAYDLTKIKTSYFSFNPNKKLEYKFQDANMLAEAIESKKVKKFEVKRNLGYKNLNSYR